MTRRAVARSRPAAWGRQVRRRLGRSVIGRVRRWLLLRYYHQRLRRPIDPALAVFGVYWYRGYSCNPRAIYEKARDSVPGFRGVWVVERSRVAEVPPGVECVVPHSRKYYDLLARAGAFVNNVNFPDELVKRPGTVHVMTHHGTPLKYMGFDLRGKRNKHIHDFDGLARRSARWDVSVSSNRHSTEVWERVYPGTFESLEVGYPRNDQLVHAVDEDAARLRTQLGVPPQCRTLLYAPTHRDDLEYVPLLDVAKLSARLGPAWVVLLRRHHSYDAEPGLLASQAAGLVLDVSSYASAEELCIASDLLVTDYSSIMFDYAILNRPIVIHAPDWELYRAARGVYFDLIAEPPGVVTRTDDELAEALLSGAAWSEEAARRREAFRRRFCSLETGQAAEGVVRRVWFESPLGPSTER
jgi:CDP-glycerol glycerophosphotransferase